MSIVNALSFDIEDYFQVEGFANVIPRDAWHEYQPRVVENTRRLLGLLSKLETRATFFVLGWVAEHFPFVVQEIQQGGHELASHGYWHRPIFQQTEEEFSDDVAKSVEAIERAGGRELTIRGYRAPTFSIMRHTLWALEVLKRHGFSYDSSVFPVATHDRYGIPDAPRFAHQKDSGLWEFPVATVCVAGRNIPVGGGGYFRLLPLSVTNWAIRRINAEGQPAVIYLHPWELDPDQPKISRASRSNRFRHYVNIESTEGKLERLLQLHRFAPLSEVFASQLQEASCVSL